MQRIVNVNFMLYPIHRYFDIVLQVVGTLTEPQGVDVFQGWNTGQDLLVYLFYISDRKFSFLILTQEK